MIKFITWVFKDGSKHSEQWDEILNGKWPYNDNCNEVIFIMNTNNPFYD